MEAREFNLLVAVNVRYFRKKKKKNIYELADFMNYSPSWVSKLENHKHQDEINHEDIEKLSKFLGVPREVLLCEDQDIDKRLSAIGKKIENKKLDQETIDEVEKLIEELQKSHGPRDQVNAMMKKGNIFYYLRKYDEAIDIYEDAMCIANKANDSKMIQLLRQNLAYCFINISEYEKARAIVEQNISDPWDEVVSAKDLHILGSLYFQQEKWTKCEEVIDKAIKILNQKGNSRLLAKCFQVLGAVHLNKNDIQLAYDYSGNAINIAIHTDDHLCRAYAMKIIGETYLATEKYEEAHSLFARTLKVLEMAKGNTAIEESEIRFLMSYSQMDSLQSFDEMKRELTSMENLQIAPRSLAKIYRRMAEKAFQLRLIDEVKEYYEKTILQLNIVIQ